MKENYIYILVTEETKKIKIGVTKDIFKRVENLQTGNPEFIEIYYYAEREDAYKIEKMLHGYFSTKKTKSNGEWFENISPLDVKKKMIELFI